jgi:sugar/nucleoside kinase (ribokinase family)
MALGTGTVMVTRGSQGVIAGRDRQSWQAGVYQNIKTLDPSGSGDAFAAGVIAAVLQGKDMPGVIRYASALGASANRALGTTDGVFKAQEAEQFILDNPLQVQTKSI